MNPMPRTPGPPDAARPVWGILVLVVLVCAGCIRLGPSPSPKTRFYLLESVVQNRQEPPPSSGQADFTVGVGPVDLPAYLLRPQIVTRLDAHRIRVDDFHRWAEPLNEAVVKILSEDLARSCGAFPVVTFPWSRALDVDIQVSIQVLRFDAGTDGTVHLQARWRLVDPNGPDRILERRSSVIHRTGAGYEQTARAMSAALGDLACEIGKAIRSALTP